MSRMAERTAPRAGWTVVEALPATALVSLWLLAAAASAVANRTLFLFAGGVSLIALVPVLRAPSPRVARRLTLLGGAVTLLLLALLAWVYRGPLGSGLATISLP